MVDTLVKEGSSLLKLLEFIRLFLESSKRAVSLLETLLGSIDYLPPTMVLKLTDCWGLISPMLIVKAYELPWAVTSLDTRFVFLGKTELCSELGFGIDWGPSFYEKLPFIKLESESLFSAMLFLKVLSIPLRMWVLLRMWFRFGKLIPMMLLWSSALSSNYSSNKRVFSSK